MEGRRLSSAGPAPLTWLVAEETPVAFLVNGENFAVMMATPADLADFAFGFALSEGLVSTLADIDHLSLGRVQEAIVANLHISAFDTKAVLAERRRSFAGRAGCGICGAQTLAAALPRPKRVAPGPLPDLAALRRAFETFGLHQSMNRENHSTHAAAFCSLEGEVIVAREDIGRHNALDKLIGAMAGGPEASAPAGFILLSSRISVEMVQKAAVLGYPALVAVSAPSALALRTARQAGITLFTYTDGDFAAFPPTTPG